MEHLKRLIKYLGKCILWGFVFMIIGVLNNVMIVNGLEASNPLTFADWYYKHTMCGLQFGFGTGVWFGAFFHSKWISMKHYICWLNVMGLILMTLMWLMYLSIPEVREFTVTFFEWIPGEIEKFKVLLMEGGLGKLVPFIPGGF